MAIFFGPGYGGGAEGLETLKAAESGAVPVALLIAYLSHHGMQIPNISGS